MTDERRKLARLLRLERIRAIAGRQALVEAGRAEGTLAQLAALVSRTEAIQDDYARRADAHDGQALVHQYRFVASLGRVAQATRQDADRARSAADDRAREAAEAEKRRAAVEDRAIAHRRAVALRQAAAPAGAARRTTGFANGTGLE